MGQRRTVIAVLVATIFVAGCAPVLESPAGASTTMGSVNELIEFIVDECGQPLDRVEEPLVFAACVLDADIYYAAGPVGSCGLILESLLPDRLKGIGVLVADSRTTIVDGVPIYDVCSVSTKSDYLIVDESGIRGLVSAATSFDAMQEGHCYQRLPAGGLREEVGCSETAAELLVGIAPQDGCLDLVKGLLPESDLGGWMVNGFFPVDSDSGIRLTAQDWCFVDSSQFTWHDGG